MGVAPSVRPATRAVAIAWGGRGGPARCEPPASAKPSMLWMVARHSSICSAAGGKLSSITREVFRHHKEVCFNTCFHEQGAGREAPGARELITKAIGELQEVRAMRCERRPASTGAAAALDMGGELRVCVNISGLNGVASQELF